THDILVIIGCQRRAFGHAVTFADLNSEALLKGAPDRRSATASPCNSHLMISVMEALGLLEQYLDYAAQMVNVRATGFADLLPELRSAEALRHRQRNILE